MTKSPGRTDARTLVARGALVGVFLALLLAHAHRYMPFFEDDSLISLRYAHPKMVQLPLDLDAAEERALAEVMSA